jgi:hypothetical protein
MFGKSYVINKQRLVIQSNNVKKILLPRLMAPGSMNFEVQFAHKVTKRNAQNLTLEAFDVHGNKIAKAVNFDSFEIHMVFSLSKESILTPNKCSRLEITSDCHISIDFSVFEYVQFL